MSNKWYAEGLQFSCQGCGDCCTGENAYVWINDEEIAAAASAKKMSIADFCKKYVRIVERKPAFIDNYRGDCIFLNQDRRCEIYAARPQQCRTFPWWKELLKSRAVWDKNPYRCPGINTGKNHSVEEINQCFM